jgi:MFS family permease
VALLLGLNQGSEWGWTSAPILGLIATAAVLLIAFVYWELRNPSPMLDLRLFSSRVFSTSATSAILNYIALYTILFLLPFYLIQGRGLNPAQAGLVLTAQPLVMAIAAPISGTLSDRIGSRLPATLGMLILAAAMLMLAQIGPQTPWAYVAGGLALAGLGTGIFISPNSSALLGAAPRNRQGIASGLLATARNVGMVLGIGLAGAILTSTMTASDPGSLFVAVRAGLLAAAGVALLSSLSAFFRGKESPQKKVQPAEAERQP